jgi:hypothetical protein
MSECKIQNMRWIEHVASIKDEKLTYFSRENLKAKDHLGDLAIDGMIILKWIL